MTHDEVLKELNYLAEWFEDPTGQSENDRTRSKALRLAIEAYEKQIPKKVQWGRTATRPNVTWICPVCRNHVNSDYCRKCGQRIDWSKE